MILSALHSLLVAALLAGDTLHVAGLRQPVEILRDSNGVSHIYAKSEHDLFFAQGYNAARDRLFQLEIWRRQATGTVAELLGPKEVDRDIGARLFKYRGDLQTELTHYHPHGPAIVGAFVDGINAYIAETRRDPKLLPVEFRMLGITPGLWTPDVVVSRHGGLLGNVEEELNLGRAVAAVGPAVVKKIDWFHPGDPDIRLDTAIDGSLLTAPILARYQAWHSPVRFPAAAGTEPQRNEVEDEVDPRDIGSNNWVVRGRLTQSGRPIMANDPHRAQSVPSLRYWIHLSAPGWDVIGGGEPGIPGVSIGHNDYGAWGLTIFATDGEDLYVYKTNPANSRQYWYGGRWTPMRIIRDTIQVKGEGAVPVTLAFTKHGPVVYEDSAHHVAYAVRAAWLEPGGAPYMAALRIDQAQTWDQFRDACAFSNIPGENMVWADRTGNIGWQAVGIAPIRTHWSGLVPVPGDGRYEWNGFLPIKEKPHALDPPNGFIATANNDLIPTGYPHMDAIGYVWADPYRWARITEVLGSGRKFSVADMERLQTDYAALPARELVPLLANVKSSNDATERARQALLGWNKVLDASSVPAGIYEAWRRRLDPNVERLFVPAAARPYIRAVSTKRIIDWLTAPSSEFGADPVHARDSLVLASLDQAVADLTRRFGPDTDSWRWGQPGYHHVTITHPLSALADPATRARLNVGPAPRGGDANTVGATGSGDNQTAGASFRIVTDVADWDAAVGANTPGQSGNPDDPHYRDLFALWAADRYFPAPYSRARIEARTESRMVLVP